MRVLARKWIVAALSLLLLAITSSAQTRFVQITDPHVFDADLPGQIKGLSKSERKERKLDAERAFVKALRTINQQIANGANYEFIVITGDLGVAHWKRHIRKAARQMADWLDESKVPRFLFVPGNNDVGNKMEQVEQYQEFIAALKRLLHDRVIDLCEQPVLDKQGRLYIGHNTASYNTSLERQLPDLKTLQERINAAGKTVNQIYIFFHIAGIDDPHLIETNRPRLEQPDYLYSAWGVSDEVRAGWNALLADPDVKAVFAGHFHSSNRQAYLRPFTWMRGSYPKDVVEKTILCPPLSGKYQWGSSRRARGFQVITLDQNSKVSTQVFWYENGQFLPNN